LETSSRHSIYITFTMATTSTDGKSAYERLVAELKAITSLNQCQSILNYDRMVFMPKAPEAARYRGSQLSALASVIHEKSTDKKLFELLEEAENDIPSGDPDAPRVLEITRKTLEETSRIPAALAAKKAEHGAMAHGAWAKARENKDFASFVPALSTCFEIAKDEAAAKRIDDSLTLYDQMLDHFETGMKVDRIDAVFTEIEKALVPLLERVRNSTTKPSTAPLKGTFDVDIQKRICREVVGQLGFEETRGRIDVAVHPFTSSSSPADVRITSRFSDDEWQMVIINMNTCLPQIDVTTTSPTRNTDFFFLAFVWVRNRVCLQQSMKQAMVCTNKVWGIVVWRSTKH